jgi:hypothetical protein
MYVAVNAVIVEYSGLPDFCCYNIPKRGKISQMTDKKYQAATKCTKIFHSKARKLYQNWDFWFQNTYTIWQPCQDWLPEE